MFYFDYQVQCSDVINTEDPLSVAIVNHRAYFGLWQKSRSKCANIMDRKRSINQNAHVRLNNTVGLDGQLRKYPDKNSSVLTPDGLNLLPLLLSFVFFNAH